MPYCQFSETRLKNDKKIAEYRRVLKQIKNREEGVHEKNHEQVFLRF